MAHGEDFDPRGFSPRERRGAAPLRSDLRRLPPAELEQRAREHVEGFLKELRGAQADLRAKCRPAALAKHHPVAVAIIGGLGGIWLTGKLLRKRRTAPVAVAEAGKPESARRAFARSFLSSMARVVGAGLPTMLFWGFRRRRRSKN